MTVLCQQIFRIYLQLARKEISTSIAVSIMRNPTKNLNWEGLENKTALC